MEDEPRNVLFVSGDADLCAVAARVLTSAGYRVMTAAHSGHAFLAGLGREQIDVLISDLTLDATSGPALAESLRRYHTSLRAIYMAEAGTRRRPGVVVRPFTCEDLLNEIGAALAVTSSSAS